MHTHTHTHVGSHLSRSPRSPFSTPRRRQIPAIPVVPHRPALLPEVTSPRSPSPPTGFSPRPGEPRPGTGGGTPRGGPSGVELLLRQAVAAGKATSARSGWSQPFRILNGGVSALMAESTASIGGYMASGYRRVAGVQLSINHLKPTRIGDRIETKANPIQVGRNVQAEVEGRGASKQRPVFCNLQLRSWTAGVRGVAACSLYAVNIEIPTRRDAAPAPSYCCCGHDNEPGSSCIRLLLLR
ncbi:hypothetical protein ACQJBY_050160 [Aegilops geniculata]